MGRLTTHVLDTARGRPACGVHITLERLEQGGVRVLLVTCITNSDGRTDTPLLAGDHFAPGTYEITFHVGDYFAAEAAAVRPFLDLVPVRFTINDENHYHVPLLVTPWSYSTYRGS